MFAHSYSVFNAARMDGHEAPALPALPEPKRLGHAAALFTVLGADIRHGGNQACYVLSLDQIRIQLAGEPGRARRTPATGRELPGGPRLRQPGDRGPEVRPGQGHTTRRRLAGDSHPGRNYSPKAFAFSP